MLRIVKSASVPNGATLSSSGGKLTYQIQVFNDGNVNASDILITDLIPAPAAFVSASCADAASIGLDEATNTLQCKIPKLSARQNTVVLLTVNVSAWTKIGTRGFRNVAELHYESATLDSNAVEHLQTNTESSEVPKMGDTENAWILLAMMGLLLILTGTLMRLIITRPKRGKRNRELKKSSYTVFKP